MKLYLRPTITGLFSITCVMLLINQFAFAATSPGDLDLTFGTSGRVTTDFGSQLYDAAHAVALQPAHAVALQPDGKIVVVGERWSDSTGEDFAVARYMDNGQLDPTFGATGQVSTDLEGIDAGMSLAIQTDGKIVVAGLAAYGQKLGLVRYKPDGSLDPTFGTMGKVISDFSTSYATAFAVLIQADGKIVAAGCTSSNAQTDFLVVRYNADGQLDGTFGQNGLVITDFAQGQDCAYAMALQPDGKIVLVGETFYANDHAAIAVARYDQNGQLDVSFNQTGQLITDVNHYQDRAYAVAVQLDGKLVLAGMTATSHSSDFLVMRYNADGSRDPLFGNNGIVTTDVFGGYDAAHALAIQSDNTIVAVGEVWDNQADFGLVHYKSDGTLDTTFGSSGKVRTDFSRSDDYGCSVAIQQDGRIIVVGQITSASGDYDFGLARYLTSLSADTPTTTPTSTPPTITATPTSMPPSGDEHQTFLPAIRR